MASVDFPELDREEGETTMAEEQPTQKDLSTEDMWDLNRKLIYASEHYDQRIENRDQKTIADAQAQAVFWQNIQERQLSLKLASQELLERQQQFWATMRERQDLHAEQRKHAETLDSIDYSRARDHVILSNRTIEPTREETIGDQIAQASAAGAAAVAQGVEAVARAQTDRTQTSAANIAELTGARQVADVNVLNTLSELSGIVQTMQTQSATSQAAFMSLTNQVAELVGAVQALTGNQPRSGG